MEAFGVKETKLTWRYNRRDIRYDDHRIMTWIQRDRRDMRSDDHRLMTWMRHDRRDMRCNASTLVTWMIAGLAY